MTGVLKTYQNSNMSLSCKGEINILRGVVTNVRFSGYPRTDGDSWTSFYKNMKVGRTITDEQIKHIVSYNGHCNVISKFTEE